MLNGTIMLVIGAGASREFGLPIGNGLLENIRNRLTILDERGEVYQANTDFEQRLRKIERSTNKSYGELNFLARTIYDGLRHAKSIDNYIRTHSDDQLVVQICKLLIADRIAQAEAESILECDGSYKVGKPQKETWLDVFTRNLFAGCSKTNLADELSKVTIVCFNYDRCIESYLANAIQKYFNIDRELSRRLVDQLEIVHPYGTLGAIWGGSASLPFGTSANDQRLFEASQAIRTFEEGVEDDNILQKISGQIANASTIVFLGFGFLRQNLELLRYQQSSNVAFRSKKVFLTAYGISHANIAQICSELESLILHESSSLVSLRPPLVGTTCADLLSNHSIDIFGF